MEINEVLNPNYDEVHLRYPKSSPNSDEFWEVRSGKGLELLGRLPWPKARLQLLSHGQETGVEAGRSILCSRGCFGAWYEFRISPGMYPCFLWYSFRFW